MNSPVPALNRPESLSNVVYDAVRTLIIEQTLPPGSRVSEAMLAERLSVSKTPVREALLRLAQSGLVVSDGRGGRIPEPSTDRLRQAYEWRDGVESQTAKLAALHATDFDRETARREAAECLAAARSGDMQKFRRHDRTFHLSLARASHNEYLHSAVVDAYDLVWTLRLRDSPGSGDVVYTAGEHEAVLEAVANGDQNKARELMSKHICNVQHFVLEAMAQR